MPHPRLYLVVFLLFALPLCAQTEPAAPATQNQKSEIQNPDDAYRTILAVMKSPHAAGVLVAEFAPRSYGQSAGLRPGDIITEYDATLVNSEDALRRAVAQAIGRRETEPNISDRVVVQVRRAGEEQAVAIRVPRTPLGLTGFACQAGVALPLNPPETARGELALEWDKLPTINGPAKTPRLEEAVGWTRLYQSQEFFAFERTALQRTGRSWALGIRTSVLHESFVAATQDCAITFAATDHTQSPGFQLDAIDVTTPQQRITAQRKGARLVGTITPLDAAGKAGASKEIAQPTAIMAVPVYALPTLAAALPQRAGLVLSFAQVSETDLQTRLGFCLQTLGKKPLKQRGRDTEAWAVQVLHFARPEMTFYFADDRTLLRADLGPDLIAESAPSEQAARQGVREE